MLVPLLAVLAAAAEAPTPIAGNGEALQLCLATRPVSRVDGDGEARDAYGERRRVLLKQKHVAEVPLSDLEIAAADETDRTLELRRREALHTREGVLLFTAERSFELTAAGGTLPDGPHALAHAVRELRAGGNATVHLVYELVDADGNGPCPAGATPGSRPVLTVRALELALRDGEGRTVATGQGKDAPEARRAPGGTPTVEVEPATVTGKGPLASAVTAKAQERLPALQACFTEALARDATLDGALVFQVEIDGKGAGKAFTVAADTVQDEALVACARRSLQDVAWGKGGPSSALLPVHFERR
jgi:hypothetical protein